MDESKLKEFHSVIKGDLAGKLKKWERPIYGYVAPTITRKEGDVWVFSAGDRKAALNWETGNTAP